MVRSIEQTVSPVVPANFNSSNSAYTAPHGSGRGHRSTLSMSFGRFNANNEEFNDANAPTHGFRILSVAKDSLASQLGLEPLFDFIIAVNDTPLTTLLVDTNQEPTRNLTPPSEEVDDFSNPYAIRPTVLPTPSPSTSSRSVVISTEAAPIDFFLYLIQQATPGSPVALDIWSAKGRTIRQVAFALPDNTSPGSLGISIQWTPLSVSDNVWHVLNVAPNSPAAQAGLLAQSDFIVAAEGGRLSVGGEDLLSRVVGAHYAQQQQSGESSPLTLFVYNADYNVIRPVHINPRRNWGGDGLLGCGVGYGLLHRLPEWIRDDDSHNINSNINNQGLYGGRVKRESNTGVLFEVNSDPSESPYLEPTSSSKYFIPATAITTQFSPPADSSAKYQHQSNFKFPPEAANEEVFGSNNDSHKSPSPTATPTLHPPPPPSAGLASTSRSNNLPPKATAVLDDYFNEEIQKSKELDRISTSAHGSAVDSSSLPPPPKAR
ncbi:hypothetical protein NADFUDRAFT_50092 [Nadsonia fulvescens var. elongata DSM 6958]|uniref:PDZ GRASP-type domain-containing protein n=1 Tax=Nadsonia fulvescens var. elongata DSM 6958 TaxID=857566 RepID=A0A1E3PQH5_9ASCO|nr:hypothetical protein NADFUDRAFT_50092 [Nadsonia fulvescens var. elongata DSM 6958]